MIWVQRQTRGAFELILLTWAGLETIRRLISLTPYQRMTVQAAIQTGGFDRAHYRAQLLNLPAFYRFFPLRHYAVFGEQLGLEPAPGFQPKTYLRLNPDVADAGVPPFWHWLTKGKDERRRCYDAPIVAELPVELSKQLAEETPLNSSPLAVHLHLHFAELWDEFSKLLGRNSLDFDLYVTLSFQGSQTLALRNRIRREFPTARIYVRQNQGRDLLPFIELLNAGLFDGYAAVCKLHGKRSLHRVDGDRWRRSLISGVFSPKSLRKLDQFLGDSNAGLWVASGHLMTDAKWWGTNLPKAQEILARRQMRITDKTPYFAGGSIYWIKPFALGMLKALDLQGQNFEPETGQLDGTTAHAVERVIGELVRQSDQRIVQTHELGSRRKTCAPPPRYVSAFYLPQFHKVPQNDLWWGKGYTEWTAMRQARPQFLGHDQPQKAADLGQYDLTPEVMAKQAKLANRAGIDGFCVYHYWFDGARLLERPIDSLLQRPDVAFPFYLCWANESWRRGWDGLSGEVLMPQTYADGFEERLAENTARCFHDPRYQRADGTRPRFVIYRPGDLPDPHASVSRLRQAWQTLGIGPVELGAVRFHLDDKLPEDLFDFWIEMPPHGLFDPADCLSGENIPAGLVPDFGGVIYDYNALSRRSITAAYAQTLPENIIRGVMPSWDNTPRRGAKAHIAHGANPTAFRAWMMKLRERGLKTSYRQELFVNAWNEWGETAMLEPSARYGNLNLQAMRDMTAP